MRRSIFQYERSITLEDNSSFFECLKDLWRKPKLCFSMFNGNESDVLFIHLTESDQLLFDSIGQDIKGASHLVISRDKLHSISGVNRLFLFVRLVISAGFNGNIKVAKHLRKAVMIKDYLNELLQKTRIQIVVLPKAENYEARLVTSICNDRGVKVVVLQHGLIGDNNYQYKGLSGFTYLVWGELFKRRLLASSPNLVVKVTGNPKLDEAFRRADKLQPSNELKRILILPNSGQSHTSAEDVYDLMDACVSLAQKVKDYRMDIKPHPLDYQNLVVSFLSRSSLPENVTLLDKNCQIEWSDYDLLAINNSTAGLEAAVYSIPLLVYVKSKENLMVPQYVENNAGYLCTNKQEFESAVIMVAANLSHAQKNSRAILMDQLAHQGRASLHVVREIKSMLK